MSAREEVVFLVCAALGAAMLVLLAIGGAVKA
jgi:hypothetical protein